MPVSKTVKNVMMVRWILGDIDVEGIKEIIGGVEGVEQIKLVRENRGMQVLDSGSIVGG